MQQPIKQVQKKNISVVRQRLGEVFKNVYDDQDTRVIVKKGGMTVGALIGPSDLERLERLDREREERLALLDTLSAPFKDIPNEEIDAQVDRAIKELRAREEKHL